MAKEPVPGKQPNDDADEKDDLLADTSMDDLDLESLLPEDPAEDRPESGAGAGKDDDGASLLEASVIDEGEIDLLGEDEPVEITADDLLDVDADPVAPAPARGGTEDSLKVEKAGHADPKTNGSAGNIPSRAEDLAEEVEDISALDLLEESDVTAPAPRAEAAGTDDAGVGPDAGQPVEEETAVLAGEGEGTVDEAPAAAKTDKGGKKADRPSRFSKKGKSGPAKPAAAEKSARPAKPGKAPKPGKQKAPARGRKEKEEAPEKVRPAAAAGVRASVPFICSECYEEFLLPANFSQEMVSCPECLHVGKRPDEDFLRAVNLHKAGERRSLALSILAGILLIATLLSVLWFKSPYGTSAAAGNETLVLSLLGAAGLFTAVLLYLACKFEGNRWEVYF